MEIEKFKKLVEEACEKSIADGFPIKDQEWFGEDCRCPMAALAVYNLPPEYEDVHELIEDSLPDIIEDELGIQSNEVHQFIATFDGVSYSDITNVSEYHKLGKYFRDKYITD